jgi:hypothetical protein
LLERAGGGGSGAIDALVFGGSVVGAVRTGGGVNALLSSVGGMSGTGAPQVTQNFGVPAIASPHFRHFVAMAEWSHAGVLDDNASRAGLQRFVAR